MSSSHSITHSINERPPTFQAVNDIELISVQDSKIISVSVYTGRAEITRLFKFPVKTGQNQLNIVGLPAVLDRDSFKVEGRGAATIHDVTISTITPPPVTMTSAELTALESKQKRTQKALARTQKSLSSLETYLASVNAEHLDVDRLKSVVKGYDETAEALDDKITALESELKGITDEINAEKRKLSGPPGNQKLNLKAMIGVFAESEGDIKIALIYAVQQATWSAGYDIRVDMQTKDQSVNLIYKASITQSTGEDWDDVPLTLETASPTFGVGVPTLTPWTLSVAPVYTPQHLQGYGMSVGGGGPPPRAAFARKSSSAMVPGSAPAYATQSHGGWNDASPEPSRLAHREFQVSSAGAVSATFGVPGLITIPSDGVGHNVTISRLLLDADMSWVCVPKKDTRVHLKAKVKNASEYTFLTGTASVYVDGSFISKSTVPLVSPGESFDCPLGLDPSVRVTYHPQNKKASQTGIYSKTSVQSFTQRITVHNTKSTSIHSPENLTIKVIDQVPLSEDSTITVKLQQPSLALPNADGTFGSSSLGNSSQVKVPAAVKVSQGVVAAWAGTDGETVASEVDLESVGKEGKFVWTCSLPSQGKVGLVLQYEISAPVNTKIVGI